MSLGDKLKAGLRQAGREVRRLKEKGELKLSRFEAESELKDRYRDLGKLVAGRFIDAGDRSASLEDQAIQHAVDAVRRARLILADLEDPGD